MTRSTPRGSYDPLPKLLELKDDRAAEAWIAQGLPHSSGLCDHWSGLPEAGWYYAALGYNPEMPPQRQLVGYLLRYETADPPRNRGGNRAVGHFLGAYRLKQSHISRAPLIIPRAG
jgi:hypothetical protein